MPTIDLHTHSSYSDGSLSPAEIIDRALESNIRTLSITDHDTMAATEEAMERCRTSNIDFLPGVEISTHLSTMSLHILGYYLDHTSAPLVNFLDSIQEARRERNQKIFQRLNNLGIKLSLADIPVAPNDSSQIGRPHIAQLLVQKRIVFSEQEAFSRYLRKNAAAYVQRRIMPTQKAIAAIRAAGGIAVFAHPASLGLSEKSLAQLIAQLIDEGLSGIEVYHPMHSAKNIGFPDTLCRKYNLIPTGGSDFHGRERDKTKLGEYAYNAPIPESIIEGLKNFAPSFNP